MHCSLSINLVKHLWNRSEIRKHHLNVCPWEENKFYNRKLLLILKNYSYFMSFICFCIYKKMQLFYNTCWLQNDISYIFNLKIWGILQCSDIMIPFLSKASFFNKTFILRQTWSLQFQIQFHTVSNCFRCKFSSYSKYYLKYSKENW